MAYNTGVRTFHQSPHHFCARCGTEQLLSNMSWQQGLLLCNKNKCTDTELVGAREAAIARALEVDLKELVPDDKLSNPSSVNVTDEIQFIL